MWKVPFFVTLTAAVASSAFASEEPLIAECKVFDAISTGEHSSSSNIDVDESGGPSVGDKTIGHRVYVGADGNKVGDRYRITRALKIGAVGSTLERSTEVVNVFSDGTIFTTKDRIDGKDLPSRINGGTGAFLGATGSVKAMRDGRQVVYKFRVNCPQAKDS